MTNVRELIEAAVTRMYEHGEVIPEIVNLEGTPLIRRLTLRDDNCYLTRKRSLTYIVGMVVTADREPDVFGAISHPARRRLLDLLVESDRTVTTLAEHFQMSRPAVSQHLRVLLDAGLVTEERHGRERHYHLVPERLSPVRDWIAQYEWFWDDRLERLKKHLAKQKKQ